MGTGSYNRHLADENIEELWQFIQVGFTQKTTNTSSAVIIDGSLLDIGVPIYPHAPEFNTFKYPVINSGPFLNKKDWPFRSQFD